MRSGGSGGAWSLEELRRLRELAGNGVPPRTIAARLRRTESAIRNKAGMHGISLRGQIPSACAENYAGR